MELMSASCISTKKKKKSAGGEWVVKLPPKKKQQQQQQQKKPKKKTHPVPLVIAYEEIAIQKCTGRHAYFENQNEVLCLQVCLSFSNSFFSLYL